MYIKYKLTQGSLSHNSLDSLQLFVMLLLITAVGRLTFIRRQG